MTATVPTTTVADQSVVSTTTHTTSPHHYHHLGPNSSDIDADLDEFRRPREPARRGLTIPSPTCDPQEKDHEGTLARRIVLGIVLALSVGTSARWPEATTDTTWPRPERPRPIAELKARASSSTAGGVIDRLQASVENSRFITRATPDDSGRPGRH
jgi:hypothetical protein